MALRRVADRADAGVEQHAQDGAGVIGRAADQEIIGRRAPILLEPLDIGLEAAGSRHQRAAAHALHAPLVLDGGRHEITVVDGERGHRRVIEAGDAERLRAPVERVERAAPAAEEEGIGLAERERAAERRLEAHALLVHP